jgi:hypothetical protein
MTTMKSMVGHIHLDEHTFGKTFLIKVISCGALLFTLFDNDSLHIYANKSI